MISLKQLNYALAIEKTLHFKKAAQMCHISQSALSTGLTQLENYLGFKVFERDNKKVLVTSLGGEVLKRAKNIIGEVNELQHLCESQRFPMSFPLTIGIIPTIAPYLVPKVFPMLDKIYPKAQIKIVEEHSAMLVDLVRGGEIDSAILALPYPHKGLLSLEFWQEDFFWVGRKNTQQRPQKDITSREIVKEKLMLLNDEHCLKDHILDVCKLASKENSHSLSATSLNTLVQMVQANLGTTLIPEMAMNQLVNDNEKIFALHLNEPSPHRRIAFIIRPNYTRLSSIEALSELCRQSLHQKN